jgi:hypothetical protein
MGYVYGESEPDERRAIEEHLTSCHVCRQEIRGLRSVRQDLLAWEVPDTDPIWRPAAPVKVESPWRAVPAWAMAAAASAVLMLGAAGGAASYAYLAPVPMVAQAEPAVDVPVSTGAIDVEAIEARLLEKMRTELESRVRLVSATPVAPAAPQPTAAAPGVNDLARRVNTLTTRQDELYDLLLGVANETIDIRSKQTGLERDNRMLVSYLGGR